MAFDIEESGPCPATSVDDVFVGVVDPCIEKVVPEELEEIFDRVQFWLIGRQEEEGDVVGEIEIMGGMPSCLIEDDDGMGAGRDLGADFVEMQVHGFGVGMRKDQSR